MRSQRIAFAVTGTLVRFAWALLHSAPTIVTANHLYAAPFGAQLDADFDSAAASCPSPSFSPELRAVEDVPPRVGRSEIRAAQLTSLRPPPEESS